MKVTRKKTLRVQEVLEMLRTKSRSIEEICQRLKIVHDKASHRAILRDFEDLRAQGNDIEADNKRPQTYTLTREALPQLKADEALVTHIALRLLFHHTSNPPQSYRNALEKITPQMPIELQKIAQLSLPNNQGTDEKFSQFEKIANCWTQRRAITFEYLALSSTSQKDRRNNLEIYLVEISRSNFEIYVIGRRTNHPPYEVRTYLLSLMQGVTPLNEQYSIPEDFDPQAYLSNAWGVIGDRKPIIVRLKFNASVRRWLEHRRLPGVLRLESDDDNNLIMTIQTGVNNAGIPVELMPFIRGWGANVEILEPLFLRELWLKEARDVIEKFGGA